MKYSQSADMCDDDLDFSRWYRITGVAGNQIPEMKVSSRRCGARYPGWMNGSHPSMEEKVVSRDVCFVLGDRPCRWKVPIKVQNCGDFYVYKLTAPTYCNQRYCGYTAKGLLIQIILTTHIMVFKGRRSVIFVGLISLRSFFTILLSPQ